MSARGAGRRATVAVDRAQRIRHRRLHIRGAYSLAGAGALPVVGADHPLRREGWRWLALGALAALAFGLALLAGWQWRAHRSRVPWIDVYRVVPYSELGVPPSIARPATPQVRVETEGAAATPPLPAGPASPVPVPRRQLAPAPGPEPEWWRAAWSEFQREKAGELFVVPPAGPGSNPEAGLSPVTRRLLAALPDSLRFTPPDTSRGARLKFWTARFEQHLRGSLPAWQAAVEARRAAAIANQRAALYGEFLLQK